jgi:hypothetical protein
MTQACVAQWLTHFTCNEKIPGSTPGTSSLAAAAILTVYIDVVDIRKLISQTVLVQFLEDSLQ